MFIAVTGVPPIAYTSLKELAAAIWPKVYGSSTIGVKKSAVSITALSSVILYTAASSEVSIPTIRFSS
jgi:tetrahydromethanopterin S-methyltransferase subunit A